MTPDDEHSRARSRFFALVLMRLSGILVMALGLAIWRTDLLRDGGWPAVGIPLALLGFVESILLPKFVAHRWRTPTGL
jgi:hypothetical protein